MFTARSRLPAEASSRFRITCGDRSSSRMARSCCANADSVSTLVEVCALEGLGGSEDMGVGGVISEREVVEIRGSSSRSSLKKRRFFGTGGGEESIDDIRGEGHFATKSFRLQSRMLASC